MWLVAAGQAALLAWLAPLVVGTTRAVRARLEGRSGGRAAQPWRDLRKLLRKPPTSPTDAGMFFIAAPVVLMSTSLLIAATAPFVTTVGVAAGADVIVVVGLLLLGTAALALAGLDTGTAFGGMGASREMTIAALVEPTLLLAVFALSTRVGSTNLGAIVAAGASDPARVFTPASLLAAAALAIATLAETARIPVDNPATHLELTMVHEAMTLEYSGRDLALVEWASAMRLTILLGLLANLFAPWGVATSPQWVWLAVSAAIFMAKVLALAALLAAGEVYAAKLRLFRVPELLAGSFALALLAVLASYVLA
ncbi:respiratory chain complex I subunit 1 family protein [Catellatospora chokoriensis]|uniref:Formate hydrogenlyase HycD n=1 Tax=Catellatospora chokoriensis TaxID=310353 RepID=A0A8J3NW15_9ACTN|nr:NADH-quinone oxidoreductase subunit H [Catellatospora chokoriensis]GIF94513.1 formate hydrogenlyase HycD [Catellatospora chokoriensis]